MLFCSVQKRLLVSLPLLESIISAKSQSKYFKDTILWPTDPRNSIIQIL
jgi:hypothetical protein